MERLMLLDGNGLIYRGYFALPPADDDARASSSTRVFGFCSIVLRGFQDVQPDYVAVAFDLAGPDLPPRAVRRVQGHPARGCRTTCATSSRRSARSSRRCGSRSTSWPGFEADDVIGTLTVQAEERGLETTIVTGDLDMLQIVTRPDAADDDPVGRPEHDHLRPGQDRGALRPRPDQMVDFKALKGDSTDNIPGVAGVGEKTAAKLIAEFGTLDALFDRIDEVTPEQAPPASSREAQRPGPREPRADDDRARPAGRARPRGRAARRLRPRGGHPPVPRVRVPDADRAAARARPASRGGDRRARSARSTTSGSIPAAQVAGRPTGWGPRAGRRVARRGRIGVGRGAGAGLQLSLDFDAMVAQPGRRRARPAEAPARPEPRAAERRRSSAAARPAERPGGAHRRPGAGSRSSRPMPSTPSSRGSRPSRDRRGARPRRPAAAARRPRWRSPSPGPTAGRSRSTGPRTPARFAHLIERSTVPLVAHEVKPLLVDRGSPTDRDGARRRRVAFDTQIAAYILNAALRSQSIADIVAERLDLILPPPSRAARDRPGRARGARRRSPSREPLARAARSASGSTACSARSSCR